MDPVTLQMAKADSRKVSRPANTIVWFGDSVTGNGCGPGSPGSGISNVSYHPQGFWTQANNLLGHRLSTLSNLGVGGDTTAMILARVSAVIALAPGWCHVQGGTNDVGAAVAVATIKANLAAIWDALDAAGIKVITGTIPPRSSYTGNQKADAEAVNVWMRDQGRRRRNLIVVDYHASLVAPASGGVYDTGLTVEGIHPSSMGSHLMARQLAAVLGPLVPANLMLSNTESDSNNLIAAGGRFAVGGSGSTPVATGYGDHAAAGTTFSKSVRTDGVNWSWQVFTVPNGSAASWIQFNVNIGAPVAVGDLVSAAVEYDISNLDAAAAGQQRGFYMRLQSYNGSVATDMVYDQYWVRGTSPNMSALSRTGILRTPPMAVPSGTTILLLLIHFEGGGTFKLDRVTMWNHTRLGLTN